MLTCDARGHGDSGGLVRARRPARDRRRRGARSPGSPRGRRSTTRTIGAWGISLGGGAVWNAVVGRRPVRGDRGRSRPGPTCTRRSRRRGSRSRGSIVGFAQPSRPSALPRRCSRCTSRARDEHEPRHGDRARGAALAPRSSEHGDDADAAVPGPARLRFDIDQAIARLQAPEGPEAPLPRRLRPPAVDVPGRRTRRTCSAQGGDWFDRFLKSEPNGIDKRNRSSSRPTRGTARRRLVRGPAADEASSRRAARHGTTIGASGKVVRAVPAAERAARDLRRRRP